jgi:hypothetical protein
MTSPPIWAVSQAIDNSGKEVIMRFCSWMLLIVSVAGTALFSGAAPWATGRQIQRAQSTRSSAHTKVRQVANQPGRSSSRFRARWIGQDGHDYVGPGAKKKPSDIQDIHLQLAGLDPNREVVFVEVSAPGGDHWRYADRPDGWCAELKRTKGSRTADVFFEPSGIESGRMFRVVVRYDDGSTAAADLQGGRADPKLIMASVSVAARWIGQEPQDYTGPGPSVGADGLEDARIHLSQLSTKLALKAIRIEGANGFAWESGTNPKLLANAELIRDTKDPTQGDLFFQPIRDLAGQRLKLTVCYENDRYDSITLAAGRCDPKLRMPQTPLPKLTDAAATATWLGQDGANTSNLGDVHVVISGLPGFSIAAAVLSDSMRGCWTYRQNERVPLPADPEAQPLLFKPRSGRKSADLFFAPYRDLAKSSFTLRLVSTDGRSAIVRFAGGICDVGRRAPQPDQARAMAKPGDDLQSLVDHSGTVVLSPGVYRLNRPLVLNRPVTITTEGGATLLFIQAAGEPPWTTAIKIHCSNTTLEGFAVRFDQPVRWNNEVSWGPAVIGMTDNLDQGHDDLKANVTFRRLDLEIPPVEKHEGWVDALRLMRLFRAKGGVIEGNILRGGPVEFFEGPWRIVDNDFRGTLPDTYSHGVFEGHGTHDVLVRGNKTRADGPSGKTWRFLVLTWHGAGDVIERNTIEQLGSRDDDTIPWTNEPEIILTEAYHVKYEGRLLAASADGRVLRIGASLGGPIRTGDAVSLLDGPAAGQWRRIVQPIDATTYLVDTAVPAGTDIVSISSGFVGEIFQDNRIDIRGGRRSDGLAFIGNHFGTKVLNNQILGGSHSFRMTACPTETPLIWGWSHAPFLGGLIEGNTLEDANHGAIFGLEHDPRYIKSNQGRVYMMVQARHNVFRWSDAFLDRFLAANSQQAPVALTLGYPPSHDPNELVVTEAGNRIEAPSGRRLGPPLLIHAAQYNSRRLSSRKLPFSTTEPAGPGAQREANKSPGTQAR